MFADVYLEYGVTANITAFHHNERGSSGFDSPYSNSRFSFIHIFLAVIYIKHLNQALIREFFNQWSSFLFIYYVYILRLLEYRYSRGDIGNSRVY